MNKAIIGCYTKLGDSKGIYAIAKQNQEWKVTASNNNEVENPTYLTMLDEMIYACVSNKDGSGGVALFKQTETDLQLVSEYIYEQSGPCHLDFDQTGRYLITSHYHAGKLQLFTRGTNGELELSQTILHQQYTTDTHPKTHVHFATFTPDQKYIIACDLGLDKLFVYPFNHQTGLLEEQQVTQITLPLQSGPRHLTFDASGKFIYVLNELSNSVMTLSYDNGAITILNESQPFPTVIPGNSGGAIHLHPTQPLLYTSQRGSNIMNIWNIAINGELTLLDNMQLSGQTPRDFNITPDGQEVLVAYQDSSNIDIYQLNIDGLMGELVQTINIAHPVCVYFASR